MGPYIPGDILLVDDYSGHGDFIGNLILDGEQARYGHAQWTHSALIVSENGDLIEALQEGVRRTNIRKYAKVPTKVLSPVSVLDANDPRRHYAVRFAEGQIGDPYGVEGFVALAVLLLTGVNGLPHMDRQPICSELVARATESYTKSGYQYEPEHMMPQDLDVYWGAPGGKQLSFSKRWQLLAQSVYWAVAPWKTGLRPRSNSSVRRHI